MTRICKNCGEEINLRHRDEICICTGCGYAINISNTIPYCIFKSRIRQLKAMHELMRNANDEEIYMSWICLMPDEPREDDFKDIALDDEEYNECFDLFIKLIQDKNNRY